MTTGGPDPIDPFDGGPGASPWSPGGAPEHGFELRTEPPPLPPVAGGSTPIVFDSPPALGGEPLDRGSGPDGSPAPRRGRLALGAGVVAVIAVAVVASLVLTSSDLDGEITATFVDADAVDDEITDTSDPQIGPAAEPDEEPAGETLPDVSSSDRASNPNDPDGDGIPLRVDVPEPLASMTQPTEIVALTEDGHHVTVSLPSGGVHVAPLSMSRTSAPDLFFSSGLLATPSFSVFDNAGRLMVVDRLGAVAEVDWDARDPDRPGAQQPFPLGWARLADGTDVAVVAIAEEFVVAPELVAVTADGRVISSDLGLGAMGSVFDPAIAVFDDGAIVTEDGGLIVRRPALDQPDEAIGRGTLFTGGPAGSVVRRCDDAATCVVELIDETGQPISTVDPSVLEALRLQFFGGSILSPSGEHVLVRGPTGNVPPNQSWVRAIRLIDGEATPIVGLSDVFSGEFPSWVADGSAIVGRPTGSGADPFPDDPGIEVVPLDPGIEPFRFAEEIGQVLSLTTRFPDAELPVPAPRSTTALEGVPLVAVGLPSIIVADTGGRVSRIDFSSGEVTSWRAGLSPGWAEGGGAQVIPRDHEGAVVGDEPDPVPSEVVVIDGRADEAIAIVGDEIAVPPDWPGGARFPFDLKLIWASVPGDAGSPATYQLVDHQSIPRSDARIPASDVIGSDGVGGLVHEYAGDVWITGFDTTVRLTSGEVWAMNDRLALAWECDADLVCDARLIDRTTGERRAVDAPLGALAVGAAPGREVTLTGTLSPDGRWALVELAAPTGGQPWGFVELATGTIVPTDAPDPLDPVIWSDDGNVAVFVSQRRLRMFDSAATAIVGNDDGLGGFDTLAAMGRALS